MARVNLKAVLARAADPELTKSGRRVSTVVETLRSWGEPLSTRQVAELLDLTPQQASEALGHAVADGRVGASGHGVRRRYYADPDLTQTLIPTNRTTEENR